MKHMQDYFTSNILSLLLQYNIPYEAHARSFYLKYFLPLQQYKVPLLNTCKITLPDTFCPPPTIRPLMKHMQDHSAWIILSLPQYNVPYETHARSSTWNILSPSCKYNVPLSNTCKITLHEIFCPPTISLPLMKHMQDQSTRNILFPLLK